MKTPSGIQIKKNIQRNNINIERESKAHRLLKADYLEHVQSILRRVDEVIWKFRI